MNDSPLPSKMERLPRRAVLQWFAAAAASTSGGVSFPSLASGQSQALAASGYGTDPDLVKVYQPGDAWPLTFTDDQLVFVTALADTILPADDFGPAASQLRVPDYVDEWISAPYPSQQKDREVVLPGLGQFEEFVRKTRQSSFSELDSETRIAVCRTLTSAPDGKNPDKALANFLHRFTLIAAGAYFSTPEGWKAIGYAGNQATAIFAGPPSEVLQQVGVEQTVN